LRHRWYRRRIERILGLVGRGEVRCDGLQLNKVCNRVEIHWRARDIHPWDRNLPAERNAAALVAQTLADTEAVIGGLFETMPQVDVMDFAVMEAASDTTIIAGTVSRSDVARNRHLLSVGMRLMELGVKFRLEDSQFEALYHDRQVGFQNDTATT
jgi:hypothetical protein